MSSLLLRLAEPFNPVGSHLSEREMALRTFRVACAIVAGLVVPFGWLYHTGTDGAFDPMSVRWAVTALALGLVGATFWSEHVQSWALHLNQACTYALTGYFGWLAYTNGLAFGYGMGFLFVFVALAMAHSLTYTRPRPFAVYLGASTLIALVVAVAVDDPAVPRTVFALSVTAAAAMIFLTVSARLSVLRALAESEAHLAEAQQAAGLGSWEKNLHTGAVRWSAGMFRLTGYVAGTVTPSAEAFLALAHPDDRDRLVDLSALRAGGADAEALAIRYQRLGSAAWRHADVRRGVVLGANGQPERVFGTIHDTTDAHEREAVLQTALAAAEDAAHAKSAFLASMSHEIRTPLTAILGFAQLLSEETGDTHRDLVEPIASAGQRLLATLNSVLDLARMDAGQGDLVLSTVDAGAEVRATAALLAGQAAARGLAVRVEAPDEPLRVHADGAALSRVLTNLVSNAVKFTDHGHVTLAVARDAADLAVFTVTDTGRGMDAAFLTELFEPFRQASTGWARSHEGTGLGLTIVKRLVEDMNGTVAVESTPGEGTRFTVVLPLAGDAPLRREAAPVEALAAAATARVPIAA